MFKKTGAGKITGVHVADEGCEKKDIKKKVDSRELVKSACFQSPEDLKKTKK